MPAVWADTDGSARKAMEVQINGLQELSADDQWRVSKIREQSHKLEREAAASEHGAAALQLRTRDGDLWEDAEKIRKDHMERAALEEEVLRSAYELTNLRPGPAEQALAYKMDPTFLNRNQSGKIRVIVVSTLTLSEQDATGNPELVAHKAWLDRVKSSIDYGRSRLCWTEV